VSDQVKPSFVIFDIRTLRQLAIKTYGKHCFIVSLSEMVQKRP